MQTERSCEKCQGAGVRAAERRMFVYEGQTVQYLAFFSTCGVCGYRWEDPVHAVVNARNAEQSCRVTSCEY
jgi:DnaJ-class molecular chaperone